jgi:non-ribosomal peptide synthetase component E (peptide arylation enzyme)
MELHFTGRLGDTVRRRGVNIACEQVEAEVLAHTAVAACAVGSDVA